MQSGLYPSKANEAATKRKQYKKKQIQMQSTLTKAEGEDIIAQRNINEQFKGKTR